MDLKRLNSNVFDAEATVDLHNDVIRMVEKQVLQVLERCPPVNQIPLIETAGYQSLLASQEDVKRSFYLSPPTRYWIRAMRRAISLGKGEWIERFAAEFASLVWTYNSDQGVRQWVKLDGSGGLRVPVNGRYIEFGPGYQGQTVEIVGAGDGFEVTLNDGMTVEIPLDDVRRTPESPLPSIEVNGYTLYLPHDAAGFGVPISQRDPWLRSQLTGTNQRRDGMQFFPEDRPFSEFEEPDLPTLEEVHDLLQVVWPDHIDEIRTFMRRIVPLVPEEGIHRAYTVSSRQGVVFTAPAPTLALAEMLVHEVAHIKMRDIQVVDMLMNDFDSDTLRVSVPWRDDPRPIPGILEGLYVFTHVAEMEKRILLTANDDHLEERFRERLKALHFAEKTVRKHADLTETGCEFVDILSDWRGELGGFQALH